MTPMRIVVDREAVNLELEQLGLEDGSVPIQAMLLQHEGTEAGNAAVMLVVEVDGQPVLAKTTLRLLEMGVMACRGAAGPHRERG